MKSWSIFQLKMNKEPPKHNTSFEQYSHTKDNMNCRNVPKVSNNWHRPNISVLVNTS